MLSTTSLSQFPLPLPKFTRPKLTTPRRLGFFLGVFFYSLFFLSQSLITIKMTFDPYYSIQSISDPYSHSSPTYTTYLAKSVSLRNPDYSQTAFQRRRAYRGPSFNDYAVPASPFTICPQISADVCQ